VLGPAEDLSLGAEETIQGDPIQGKDTEWVVLELAA